MRPRIDLNGEWFFVFDPRDIGLEKGWNQGGIDPFKKGVPVLVPHTWEAIDPDYTGVGWCFKEFYIPRDLKGRRIIIKFGAVDYMCQVWLNGLPLGGHEGGYTPFELDGTQAARFGAVNHLWVRVVNPHGPQGCKHIRPNEFPSAKEGGYGWFAGIWQDVELMAPSQAWIRDAFIMPDIQNREITCELTFENNLGALKTAGVRALVELDGRTRAEKIFALNIPRGAKKIRVRIPVPNQKLWSPQEPNLYQLRLFLEQGKSVLDGMREDFGMREFTIRNHRFQLNGREIFLRGALHQPDEPLTLAMPPDGETARREVSLAKDAGFNLLRLHIKTAHPATLRWADSLGMLLYEEPPIGWIKKSEFMWDRCAGEVREMVLRDRNHPSVVIWGMLNESGNAGYVVHGGAQDIKEQLCIEARKLDPTRIIIDDSAGVNATKEASRFMLPGSRKLVEYEDLHVYQRAPVDEEIEDHYRRQGDPDKLFFLSEFGFGGMEDLRKSLERFGAGRKKRKAARLLARMLDDAEKGYRERELDRVFGSFSEFCRLSQNLQAMGVREQVRAIRSNPILGGYVFTQLFDAGTEFCAGVGDRWRRPKPVFHALREVQKDLLLIPRLRPRNRAPGQKASLEIIAANASGEAFNGVPMRVTLEDLTGNRFLDLNRKVDVPVGVNTLDIMEIHSPEEPKDYNLRVRLQFKSGAEEAWEELHVLDPGFEVLPPVPENVEIIGPESNTVWAYDIGNLIEKILKTASGAATLIVLEPPPDANELFSSLGSLCLDLRDKDAVGAFLGVYHWVKPHKVFQGLPTRRLMDGVYRHVIPARTFLERGVEDICGALDTTPIADGQYMIEGKPQWWGADISVQRLGRGFAVLSHLRLTHSLGFDPAAKIIYKNLLEFASELADKARKSAGRPQKLPNAKELLAGIRKKLNAARPHEWMVIGPFENYGCRGFDQEFPPERELDFSATYEGWYKPVSWKPWRTRADKENLLDLQDAFTPIYCYYPRHDSMTGCAFTTFEAARSRRVKMRVRAADGIKVWLNGRLVYSLHEHSHHQTISHGSASVTLRRGRNELFVKVTKIPGRFRFMLNFLDGNGKEIKVF